MIGRRPDDFRYQTLSPPEQYGWSLALLEMLVDPVLVRWVPQHVVEQYRRWNPFFVKSLRDFGPSGARSRAVKPYGEYSNRQLLLEVKGSMEKLYKAWQGDKEEAPKPVDEPGDERGASAAEPEHTSSDEDEQAKQSTRTAMQRDALPDFDADQPDVAAATGDWVHASAAEQLSAAGPAPAAPDRDVRDRSTQQRGVFRGVTNPQGYDWEAENYVTLAEAKRAQTLWKQWTGGATVDVDEEELVVTGRSEEVV